MVHDIMQLKEILGVPKSGTIDFRAVLGSSFNDMLERFRNGHFPVRKKTVHRITFDEPLVSTSSLSSAVIDTLYKATHGVEFVPCLHTYDWATDTAGFEPMQPRSVSGDFSSWEEPHVFAVHDSASPQFRFSTSPPNTVNVGYGSGSSLSQLLPNTRAIRINFDQSACAVQMRSDYRIHHEDRDDPISNWPQLLAYAADGTLLDQDEAPYGGVLAVSSWADDIAYVMVTVDNRWGGVEPLGIFDDLSWTTVEFVLRYLHKLRSAPKPVPRRALMDQVGQRLAQVQATQLRLQHRLTQVADADLAALLQVDMAELQQQTQALQRSYSRATRDTAAAPVRVPLEAPA